MAKSQDKLGQLVTNRFNFAHTQQETLFEDFARFRQLWKSKIEDTTNYPWDYALFNPMVYSTVRSFVARTASGNVGVTLQAWNESGRPKAQVNKALLDWEFQEAQLFLHLSRAIFSACLYGKGFLETGWLFQKARVVEEEDEKGNVIRKVTVSPTVNRADLKFRRVFDVLVGNRNIPDLQKQPWIVLPGHITVSEMERENEAQGKEVYKPEIFKKIKDKKPFVSFVDYGFDVSKDADEYEEAWKSGVIPTLKMLDRNEGTVTEIVKGESDLILRSDGNPYYHGEYPLIDLSMFPDGEDFWNMGLVQPIEDLQVSLNSTLNQYQTNARQQLNNMWITGDIRIPDWEFISRPNGVIHTSGDIQQIREVTHKDITGQALSMMGELKGEIERTSGINDFLAAGNASANNKTASGLSLEQQNLDQNLKLFMTLLEQVSLTKLATQFLKLNAQYITSEQTVGITGRHGYKHVSVKPDEVSPEFTPIVIPNSTLPKNPMVRLQNLQNLKAMADKEQKIAVNTAPIWKEMVSTLGLTDLDEIVPDDRDEALEENDLLSKGIEIDCEVSDNHDLHIVIHQFELMKGELDPETTQRVLDHIKTHKLWKMSQDPELLDKMANPPQVAPMPMADPMAVLNPAMPVEAPIQGLEGMPNPSPAVDEQGLLDQLGQQFAQAANPITPEVPFPQGEGGLNG